MFTECPVRLTNDHLIIPCDGNNVLVDTGSPLSFHPSGNLTFEKNSFAVHTNIPGVSTQYLSEKVGCEINGLLGMDVINSVPMLFSLKNGFMFIDDDAEYLNHFRMYPLSPLADGLVAVTISINGMKANMIVDSGAPISYIRPEFVSGLECVGTMEDFSPFIGNFQTETFQCEVKLFYDHGGYIQRFGIPPQIISMTLDLLKVDGIIGVELFKRNRLQFKNQIVYLPPQGI